MRLAIAIALVGTMTGEQIERAQQVARSRDSERAEFHRKYVFVPPGDIVTQIELVTEFRRLVMITEQHLFAGDQMFSRGVRQAEEALAPTRGVLTLRAHLQFHPLNAYVTVPEFQLALGRDGGSEALVALDTKVTGEFARGPRNRGRTTTITGATLQADVPASRAPQATGSVGVVLEAMEIARVSVDFARID